MIVKKIYSLLIIGIIALQFTIPIHAETSIPPRIIVEDCTVEGGGLSPNTITTVSFAVKNTSSTQTAYGVLITAEWKTSQSSPTEFVNTNQVYIDEIKPGEIGAAEFEVRTKAVELVSIKSIQCNLLISFYHVNESRQSGVEVSHNDITVQIPILENMRDYEIDENFPQNTTSINNILNLDFSYRQLIYIIGFVSCLTGLAIILYKRRKKSDWKL